MIEEQDHIVFRVFDPPLHVDSLKFSVEEDGECLFGMLFIKDKIYQFFVDVGVFFLHEIDDIEEFVFSDIMKFDDFYAFEMKFEDNILEFKTGDYLIIIRSENDLFVSAEKWKL